MTNECVCGKLSLNCVAGSKTVAMQTTQPEFREKGIEFYSSTVNTFNIRDAQKLQFLFAL
jgi:hypothetical protein